MSLAYSCGLSKSLFEIKTAMKKSTVDWKWIIKSNQKINLSNKNLAKIFEFFVLKCPVDKISKRSVTFDDLKINQSSFCSVLKKEIPVFKINWETMESAKIEKFLQSKEIFDYISKTDCFAYHTNYMKNEINPKDPVRTKLKGLFYCIRCAFAHGDFNIRKYDNKRFYQFQNTVTDKEIEKIKGRILLEEEMLLKMIQIIENWEKK